MKYTPQEAAMLSEAIAAITLDLLSIERKIQERICAGSGGFGPILRSLRRRSDGMLSLQAYLVMCAVQGLDYTALTGDASKNLSSLVENLWTAAYPVCYK